MSDIRIPKDPDERERFLAQFLLTDEERLAINKWCALMADEDRTRTRRGLEANP